MCIRDRAESVLLEPYYEFRMELPLENVGKAMTDIKPVSYTHLDVYKRQDQLRQDLPHTRNVVSR